MKSPIRIYQTLEDRDNYIDCEDNGPYSCAWENTWLGEGYYFWYHHLDPAHWWGHVRYGEDNYVIYKSLCHDISKCWDLHGNGEHQSFFIKWLNKLEERGKLSDDTTVAQVIEFVKNEYPKFDYEGIRILGIDSISQIQAKKFQMPRLPFEIKRKADTENIQRFKAYFDIIPPVQICIFSYEGMGRQEFNVVFPEDYRSDFKVF